MVPHSTGTYEMFRNLLEHSPDDTPFPDHPECLRSIYADNFVKDFPAETFYSMDSFMTAAVIADECSVTTMRSENGHTLWQREARLKSCQTISDSFQCVAASTLLIRQRKIERAGARLTQMPKKRGRPKKVKKSSCTVKTKKLPKWRRHLGITIKGGRKTTAYDIFVSDNCKGKAEQSGGQLFQRLSEKWRSLGADEIAEYTQRAIAKTQVKFPSAAQEEASAHTNECAPANEEVARQHAVVPWVNAEEVARCSTDTLAVFNTASSRTLRDGQRELGKHFRNVCSEVRTRDAVAESACEQIVLRQSQSFQHEVLKEEIAHGCRVTTTNVGADAPVERIDWSVPAIQMAKEIAKRAGEPRTQFMQYDSNIGKLKRLDFHSSLREEWSKRSKMTMHEDLPLIGSLEKHPLAQSLCRSVGRHICDREDVLIFRISLLRILRALYKKDKANLNKKVLEDARGVLRLLWWPLGVDTSEAPHATQWFHCSYCNQNSWATCLTELVLDTGVAKRRAEAAGNVALTISGVDPGDVGQIADPFKQCGVEVLPCQFLAIDLSCLAQCVLYEMVDSDRDVDEFLPRQLEVSRRNSLVGQSFWPGSCKAIELAAAARSKAKEGPHHSFGGDLPVVCEGPAASVAAAAAAAAAAAGPSGEPCGEQEYYDGDQIVAEPIPEWLAAADEAALAAEEEPRSHRQWIKFKVNASFIKTS